MGVNINIQRLFAELVGKSSAADVKLETLVVDVVGRELPDIAIEALCIDVVIPTKTTHELDAEFDTLRQLGKEPADGILLEGEGQDSSSLWHVLPLIQAKLPFRFLLPLPSAGTWVNKTLMLPLMKQDGKAVSYSGGRVGTLKLYVFRQTTTGNLTFQVATKTGDGRTVELMQQGCGTAKAVDLSWRGIVYQTLFLRFLLSSPGTTDTLTVIGGWS